MMTRLLLGLPQLWGVAVQMPEQVAMMQITTQLFQVQVQVPVRARIFPGPATGCRPTPWGTGQCTTPSLANSTPLRRMLAHTMLPKATTSMALRPTVLLGLYTGTTHAATTPSISARAAGMPSSLHPPAQRCWRFHMKAGL